MKTTPTNTNWSLLKDFGIEPYGSDEGGSDTTYSFRVEEYIGVSGLHIGDEFDATRIIEPPECDDGQIPWVYITENLGFPYNSTQTLTQEMTATAKDGIIDVVVGCKTN